MGTPLSIRWMRPDQRLSRSLEVVTEDEQGTFFKHSVVRQRPLPRRQFIVDSGASFHLICRKLMTHDERKTIRQASAPITMHTANGVVSADLIGTVFVYQLGMEVECYILPDVPPLLSLGRLCLENHFRYVWEHGEPFLQKMQEGAPKIYCTLHFNCPYLCNAPCTSLDEGDRDTDPTYSEKPVLVVNPKAGDLERCDVATAQHDASSFCFFCSCTQYRIRSVA